MIRVQTTRNSQQYDHEISRRIRWPLLVGANSTSPREFLPVTSRSIVWRSQYKLLVNTTATHDYTPNRTTIDAELSCEKSPCLFDLLRHACHGVCKSSCCLG